MSDPTKPKPTIDCTPNGPYLITGLSLLRNSKGDELPARPKMALCRCGGSANKPFCDGTHAKIGFSDARLRAEPPTSERVAYRGQRVTILDNRSVCAHAGYCTDGLPTVWKQGGEPWIDPDGADAQAIIEVVRRCPSGALACAVDGVECSDPEREPQITVSKDGPYHVVGGPELRDPATGQTPQSREHFTLCRCGGSQNKPFCDGTHWHIGFRDDKN
ncbi:MAG TPA: CDGSH iron-sulfur domain-containing protein [Polyangia bacterium]|nr:CDGSH iron-sulfur domain-containing protein [Polyangia bacterium]